MMTSVTEAIRLVIWDLDDVFWHGTLAEGQISHLPELCELVVTLARRGIMSAICSKNDFAAARDMLTAQGVWDYFVFPSIDYTPKGPRIAALVAAVQLRPESILFIDDNPANLAEAEGAVPGLRLAGPDRLARLLDHPAFVGKDDTALTRLAQYKLLDQRHAVAATGDNLTFLRDSGITVSIDYDIEANIDRAVELINRTNQLNFTKTRLPEEPAAARAALRGWLAAFGAFAGLVRVTDKYGDHGHAGFFLVYGRLQAGRVQSLCFSCRVLNMGVERFIYDWLGRPELTVAAPVACDIFKREPQIDWITLTSGSAVLQQPAARNIIDRLVLRGGCDLCAMSYYLGGLARETHFELNTARAGRQFRIDHVLLLNHVFGGMSPAERAALESVGYEPRDWNSALARPGQPGEKTVWLLSFWTDAFLYLYKHKALDITVPFLLEDPEHYGDRDVTYLPAAQARAAGMKAENLRAWEALKQDFWGVGVLFEDLLLGALEKLFTAAAEARAMVIIVLPPEHWRQAPEGHVHQRPLEARLNGWMRAAVVGQADVHLVEMRDFVDPAWMGSDLFHFGREVYLKAALHITGLITARFGE